MAGRFFAGDRVQKRLRVDKERQASAKRESAEHEASAERHDQERRVFTVPRSLSPSEWRRRRASRAMSATSHRARRCSDRRSRRRRRWCASSRPTARAGRAVADPQRHRARAATGRRHRTVGQLAAGEPGPVLPYRAGGAERVGLPCAITARPERAVRIQHRQGLEERDARPAVPRQRHGRASGPLAVRPVGRRLESSVRPHLRAVRPHAVAAISLASLSTTSSRRRLAQARACRRPPSSPTRDRRGSSSAADRAGLRGTTTIE